MPPSPIQLKMVRQYEDHIVQQAHDRVFEQSRSVPQYCFPPGMTEGQFRRVIQNLKTIVGDDQVFTEDSLLHFSDPFSPSPKNFPSAAAWYVEIIRVSSPGLKLLISTSARTLLRKSERFWPWRMNSIFRYGLPREART